MAERGGCEGRAVKHTRGRGKNYATEGGIRSAQQ